MIQQSRTSKHAPATQRAYDELLVTMVRAGDRAALERLAVRWQPKLIRTATRYLGTEAEAQIAVQECWIAIIKGVHRLKSPAKFAPWVYGILRRKCADAIRTAIKARDREAVLFDDAASQTSADPTDGPAIRRALASLPPDQRLAAHLYFVEGLTLVEISEVQDVPLGTATSRLFHARRQLKAALSGDDQ